MLILVYMHMYAYIHLCNNRMKKDQGFNKEQRIIPESLKGREGREK